jgi:hypothetical protein
MRDRSFLNGRNGVLNQWILSKLSQKEQEFVKMGMREKISKLSDDNK